jgi:RNA polymerase sigma factor (sigma-70 family)
MSHATESNGAEYASFVSARWEQQVVLARGMLGANARADAEDLVQEALIRLASRWGAVRDPDAYMRRILANLTTDHHRRQARWKKLWPHLVAHTELETEAPSAEVDAQRDISAVLASLPTRQRQVLALYYLADASEGQISAALGCSVGTVKTHLSRGLSSLRRSMAAVSTNDSKGSR